MERQASAVRAIFDRAREIDSSGERAAFLEHACADAPDVRAEVEALLRAGAAAGSFLESPAAGRLVGELAAAPDADDTRTGPAAANADEPLDFLAPSDRAGSLGRLGHYEVQQVVGRGGMGVVLKAFDEKLHRVVAVKVMAPQLAASATARQRFMREARAQAAVTHDHVVTIHSVEETNGLPSIVMQFVDGASLQDRIDRGGPLALCELLRIGTQAALGLAAAHKQGLVHRDVKPANILLENGVERVKLTDFGLARAADDASLTQSGVVAGTPSYMSPEQAEGKPVDYRSDLFSLGSVLYAMCTGRPPFRGSTSRAVLRRVVEETTPPLREANSEISDWLAEVIAKLQAKDPADRYQSAAEVAEVLGRHLAQVQHPSVIPFPAPEKTTVKSAEPAPASRSRWAMAAAALLCVVAGLGVAEATGTTKLKATVVRFFTVEGTLVVETDDPAVKVTVEGDGDLVITGAGPQEVRLRAGSYKVWATKDGQPVKLDRDLVTISRGDTQIVRVRLEGAAPAATAPPAVRGVFVLLGGQGVAELKFDTLAEAVKGATDGDTIEIRGNGPFVTESLRISAVLTIRAGPGFRPVIRVTPEFLPGGAGLVAEAPLELEGLELQWEARPLKEGEPEQFLLAANRGLYAANCRFLMRRVGLLPRGWVSPCELRNCEVLCSEGDTPLLLSNLQPDGQLVLENCLVAGLKSWQVEYVRTDEEGRVRLTRNTFLATLGHVHLLFSPETVPDLKQPNEAAGVLRVEASGNVFDTAAVLAAGSTISDKQLPADDLLPLLGRHCEWKGERNVYAVNGPLARASLPPDKDWEPLAEMRTLADWRRFWKTSEAGSAEGPVRYEGGNLRARLAAEPGKLTPGDFRLRQDSAGYRADRDGKDLGADVDLVGPGAAYERWKKTPAYQQWHKDTAPVRVKAPELEPGAFVRLGGHGVAERRFDTLTEAARFASDGDIIEVRGNGPFATEPIDLGRTALTIRAGAGFRPVIKSNRAGDQRFTALLKTEARLSLEGLEFQRVGPEVPKDGDYLMIVYSSNRPLHAANCRFVGAQITQAVSSESAFCELRNCEFLGRNMWAVVWDPPPDTRLVVTNCLLTGQIVVADNTAEGKRPANIQLTNNTLLAYTLLEVHVTTEKWQHTLKGDGTQKILRVDAAGNVIVASPALAVWVGNNFPVSEAENALAKGVGWKGGRNLFSLSGPFLSLPTSEKAPGPSKPLKTLADWKQFWGSPESGSVTGQVRFQRSNLPGKIAAAPDAVIPDDFRLRPTSVGYRADEGGRDLGADVDLVGPGAAYERWKKTPEYLQWLKDTGQVRK